MRWIILGAVLGLMPGAVLAHPGVEGDHPSNQVEIVRLEMAGFFALGELSDTYAECRVHFELHDYGETVLVMSAQCTHPGFCAPAVGVVEQSTLRVIDVEGAPIPGSRANIVLPIINPGTGDKPDIQPEDYLPCEMAGF